MIPNIETILIEALERRIVEALPETAPNPEAEPETFVSSFETRKFTPCIQAQETLTIFGEVEAEISVVFYSQKERMDYTPLYVSLAKNRYIKLAEGVFACVRLGKCEAVEGPYLSNDAWIISAKYYVFEIGDGLEWQPPRAGERGTSVPDLYPRPTWDKRDEPEAVI